MTTTDLIMKRNAELEIELELLREVERWARGTKRCQLCATSYLVGATGTGGLSIVTERHADDCPLAALDAHRAKSSATDGGKVIR